jgi:hypothetical protein
VPGQRSGDVTYRATAGAKPRQGNSRFCYEADRKIDARSQTQDSPRRTSGNAAQIRGSEHDHRRLKASPPPLHDHNLNGSHTDRGGERRAARPALDRGHQSKITTAKTWRTTIRTPRDYAAEYHCLCGNKAIPRGPAVDKRSQRPAPHGRRCRDRYGRARNQAAWASPSATRTGRSTRQTALLESCSSTHASLTVMTNKGGYA